MMSHLLYDANLILQIVTIALLFLGRSYAKRKRFRTHGLIMTTATTLHVLSILLIMAPSFIRYFGALLGPPTLGIVITWIHAASGIVAAALALLVVTRWRLQTSTAACIKRRQFMKPLLFLWTTSLLLGIGFYILYYL